MENRLREIVESLVDSYHEVGGINRMECSNLPSNRKIVDTCDQLLQVLFPGYHDREPVPAEELEVITSERIAHLMSVLRGEIAKTLRFRDGEDENDTNSDFSTTSQLVISDFLSQLAAIRHLLKTDVEAAYEGDPAARNYDEIILAYPCITAIAIQRCAHALYKMDVPLIPRIMTEYAHGLTGIDIHPGATIGTHFFIDHGTGVVIGETCTIGNHVKLYHGVTLGARNFPKDKDGNIIKGHKRHPDVEDNVVVYPHATILGGQTVLGKGATIAANVFLRESVPPNSFVSTKGEELIVIDKTTKERIMNES
jgi:serine O-acetyltransferase